jgi:hypothetical protein
MQNVDDPAILSGCKHKQFCFRCIKEWAKVCSLFRSLFRSLFPSVVVVSAAAGLMLASTVVKYLSVMQISFRSCHKRYQKGPVFDLDSFVLFVCSNLFVKPSFSFQTLEIRQDRTLKDALNAENAEDIRASLSLFPFLVVASPFSCSSLSVFWIDFRRSGRNFLRNLWI